jgi:preprotein translocase subunit SecD
VRQTLLWLVLVVACKKGPHVELTFELEPACAAKAPANALDRTLEVMRERLAQTWAVVEVTIRGDRLVVDLGGHPEDQTVRDIGELTQRIVKLEVRLVDDDSDYMRQLCDHVRRDPKAADLGVRAEQVIWTTPDGHKRESCTLVASDPPPSREHRVHGRDVLAGYLDALSKFDPFYIVPADRELGYRQDTLSHRDSLWSTEWLTRQVELTGDAIAHVKASYAAGTERPIVEVELTPEGLATFAALVRGATGKRFAVLVDGRVRFDGILEPAAVHGDRLWLTPGGDDLEGVAFALVGALRAGSQPCPLRAVGTERL